MFSALAHLGGVDRRLEKLARLWPDPTRSLGQDRYMMAQKRRHMRKKSVVKKCMKTECTVRKRKTKP